MFAGQDRSQTREVFFRAWRRHREGQPLEGIEEIVVRVAHNHPEYHSLLDSPESYQDRDYSPEQRQTNPFLHMGMHIAIEEQLSLDQPQGIRGYYQKLRRRLPDEHTVQHHIMECLGEMLWQANRQGQPPQASVYLECLQRLTGETG
jgi:hypothetical protein